VREGKAEWRRRDGNFFVACCYFSHHCLAVEAGACLRRPSVIIFTFNTHRLTSTLLFNAALPFFICSNARKKEKKREWQFFDKSSFITYEIVH